MRFIINPNYLTVILFLLLFSTAQSQTDSSRIERSAGPDYPPLEIGLLLGGANAYGDLVDTRFFKPSNTNFAFGFFVRYNASPNLSLKGSFNRGTLTGSDLDSETLAFRGLSFESTVTDLSVVGEFDFLGHTRYSNRGRFKGKVSPYIFAGFALGMTDGDTDFSNLEDQPDLQESAQLDIRNQRDLHTSLPIGLGAKIDLNSQWVLGVEVGLRPVFNDYLDGVSAVGNPDRNDWYSIGGLTLSYRIGSRDRDKDGFPDKNDPCPDLAGTEDSMGCPDSDQDGLFDNEDRCPDEAGSVEAGGCPDQDGDTVADKDDKCPDLPGSVAADGCPDRDGDGVVDDKDYCPNIFGVAEHNGCRDTDKDGIADPYDDCPYEKGEAALNGCPPEPDLPANERDSDNDGIVDAEDDCPYLAGTAALNGCQDMDKDGVADPEDDCPYVKGTAEHNGCPDPALTDTDGDGILDSEDPCPREAGTLNGCPDSDSDGIADADDPCPNKAGLPDGCPDTDGDGLTDDVDNCPELPGEVSNNGCPELTAADEALLQSAVDNVRFIRGDYKLISSSYPALNKIAALLKKQPDYHIRIEGHTDNQGDADANKQLSRLRAKACFDYLHENGGIPKERMSYEGFGSEQPRANNDTRSGRRQNRRVEFTLHKPE